MIEWQKHELLKPPTDEEMAVMEPEELIELHRVYHEAIENSVKDPYRFGFVLPNWETAWKWWQDFRTLFLSGANRSGKTSFGAKSVVKALLENAGSTIYCFCQNESVSREVQQAAIYQALPAEMRKKKTGDVHYISYSAQNGFTSNGFILPNGSRCKFLYYTQFQQDQSILEGMELGSRNAAWLNIGAWCDEYLGGMELLDRLYLRLATRNAKLLLTFTPKDGITETVGNFIRSAQTVESRTAELVEVIHGQSNYKVPFIQTNKAKNTAIIYFHTKDNPWSGYESVVEMCRSKNNLSYTLTAAYGVATKTMTTKFPKFGEHNIMEPDALPKKNFTRYQIIDPAGRKNWATAWIDVVEDGTWYISSEWPDESVGPWIESGKDKWVPGEGAKGLGYGYRDYLEIFEDIEGKAVEVYERLIDPRLGAQRYQKADGDSSIIEDLNDLDFIVKPAPGIEIEDGLQKVIELMAYDENKPIDANNRPKFYVSSRCQNMIQCLREYTGEGGKDEAAKDFVDLCRYAAAYGIDHVPQSMAASTYAGAGGY